MISLIGSKGNRPVRPVRPDDKEVDDMDKMLLLGESKHIEYKREYTKTLLKTMSVSLGQLTNVF